jgi:hypothetical protein
MIPPPEKEPAMPRSPLASPRRPVRFALLLLILLGPLFLRLPEALGQGTEGALPDPIADRGLSAYARRLGLSDQQRLAIDAYHAQYLDEFRQLREKDIDRYLRDSADVLRRFMFAASSKETRRSLNELDRLMSRIKSLDEGLFDRIQTVLSEEQARAMPGVRQMRERERYRSGLVRFIGYANPGARIDLADFVETMELAPKDRQAIEPLVMEYEGQLTAALRKLYQATTDMFLDMVKQAEELMLAAERQTDPQAARQAFRSIRDIWSRASTGVMGQAAEISALNRRSFRGFAPLLSEDAADRLQAEYYQQAYPDVHRGMIECLGQYDAALKLPGLSDEQRSAIAAARRSLRDRHQRLAEQMIDLHEAMRKTGMFFGFRGESAGSEREKLRSLQAQRDELNERALESLLAMLGRDLGEELHRTAQAEESGERGTGSRSGGMISTRGGRGFAPTVTVTAPDESPTDIGTPAGPDPYLPPPISPNQLAPYARLLEIGDDQRVVLEALHSDYLDAYETVRADSIEPMLDAAKSMWAIDPDSHEIRPPSPEAIDNIELAILDDDDASRRARVLRLRLARQRIAYNRDAARSGTGFRRQGGRMMFGRPDDDNREFRIDVTALIEEQYLTDEERATIEPAFTEYQRLVTDAFKRRYELAFQYGQATERMSAAAAQQEGGPGRGFNMSFGTEFRRLMQTVGRQLREAERAIAELNRSILERLAAMVSPSSASSLRSAYRRQAYPQVYADPGAAEDHFVAALALPDLAGARRTQITDILAEYRGSYAALCEQMADIHAREASEEDPGRGGDPDIWQRRQERRNQLERLRFDRNELNEKALRQLRAALTEEQLRQLGLVETQ